jgi:UDP-glucose 4-epimerase
MGYIGSHTVVELREAGYQVVILDNLCNSSPRVLERLAAICGNAPTFVQCDARDAQAVDRVFAEHSFDSVIHFAGLKAVGESVTQPLEYYDNNLVSTLTVVRAMRKAQVRRLVFSSSATVYGDPASVPIREDFPLQVTNPYGRTKLMCEQILTDVAAADPQLQVALLRYFNPVGAHESGTMGESPNGTPNNLMPYISQVAVGRLKQLSIFGNDYPTPDGTGVRDYIHVVDLAAGHVAALRAMEESGQSLTVNLGTGKGISVLDLVAAFERVTGVSIPTRIAARRPGDIAACYADPGLANRLLGWRARRDVDAMCRDAWRWQSANPAGYGA